MQGCFSHIQLLATPWTVASRLLCPWNFPGKNIGVGCHFLLQGILYIVVCICESESPNLSLLSFPLGNCKFVFCIYDSIYVLQIGSFVPLFLDSMYKQYHIFVFLFLTSLRMTISRSIHVTAHGTICFFFMAE